MKISAKDNQIMINPIYFPFTYISTAALTIFQTLFQAVTVYQPSRLSIPHILLEGENADFIDLRIPVTSEEKKLDTILKDFRNWAGIHRESRRHFLKFQGDRVPFFEEFSASQIKADIKKSGAVSAPNPLFNARLFLQVAQEFDQYHDELNQELVSLDQAEQDLYKNLKGENLAQAQKCSVGNGAGHTNPPDYMIFERLRSWTRLFLNDRTDMGCRNLLFITTSPAVLDMMVEGRGTQVKKVLCFQNLPVEAKERPMTRPWQDDLGKRLQELAEKGGNESMVEDSWGPEGIETVRKAAFSVYLIPGESPYEFLRQTVGMSEQEVRGKNRAKGAENTLIGVMDIL